MQLKPATCLEIIVSVTCKQHRRKEHNWWLTDAPEETVKGPATFNPAIAATFNAMKNFKSRPRIYYCMLALISTRRLCKGRGEWRRWKRPKQQKNKNPTKSPTRIEDMYPGRIPPTNSRIAIIITRQRRFADAIGDAISYHRGREVSQRASERAPARTPTKWRTFAYTEPPRARRTTTPPPVAPCKDPAPVTRSHDRLRQVGVESGLRICWFTRSRDRSWHPTMKPASEICSFTRYPHRSRLARVESGLRIRLSFCRRDIVGHLHWTELLCIIHEKAAFNTQSSSFM
jgi:hypothetical protein